ncbi:helix-turn-helix domain-containing protein [Rossellomorea aquimaris]|uniref:helix-turn-helix domain-containing protein n=1 Tax=Rossellomorea aquimaris TaxID=189382 RepID=UPI0011E90AF3|nr:helix-turn-helix domain-containing protein [Rossellomorea aquimaris]TYS87717.1 helix-turn-helix domain-containing protein [Rossellomorea aquimaris]
MKEYNVHEALSILQEYFITDSIQMITRWIREGKIPAVRGENRKEGYKILDEDLFEFIEEQRPGLPFIMEVYQEHVKKITPIQPKQNCESIENTGTNKVKDNVAEQEKMISELQEEKQILEFDVLELKEQINELIKTNELLTIENQICNELYGLVDDENLKLKTQINSNSIKKFKNKSNNGERTDLKMKSLSYNEFENLGLSLIKKMNKNLEEDEVISNLKEVYQKIFDVNGCINGNYLKEKIFICPYTHREYKSPKAYYKNLIRNSLKNIEKSTAGQVELTIVED